MIIITIKFATSSEQYDGWGNNINFIIMKGPDLPPPLNNMLAGVITSTLSSHPPEVSSEHVQRVTIEKTT
jgi:hypothetical protein